MKASPFPQVDQDEFRSLVQSTCTELLVMAAYAHSIREDTACFSRPFLGRFQLEAGRAEELLDAYGAKHNTLWYPFRGAVAAAKTFSQACYNLLHIKHAAGSYHLLPIREDFPSATQAVLETMYHVLFVVARYILKTGRKCGLQVPDTKIDPSNLQEHFLDGRLPADRKTREVTEPGKVVVHLATAFLNVSGECRMLDAAKKCDDHDLAACFPEQVSEEKLRRAEERFHNLQSMYDTYISDTNIETIDENLPMMRGHISLIFHLFEIATMFAHYYERHMTVLGRYLKGRENPIVSDTELLRLLFRYVLAFIDRYMGASRGLCQTMIKNYAEMGRIRVPVPNYRGFHVRPSTMISKIVLHYGSNVYLEMDGDRYDASVPLELFRVNEKINSIKRKRILQEAAQLPIMQDMSDLDDIKIAMRIVFFALLEERKIILYDRVFCAKDLDPKPGESLPEYVKRAVIHCMAIGKIDVETDITVDFVGDKRVLEDIKLLAESGYGEDSFGNDVMLPEDLAYLRR